MISSGILEVYDVFVAKALRAERFDFAIELAADERRAALRHKAPRSAAAA